MLGPDWQVDVTDLVQDSLKVADPRIAELVDRTVLVGLELGSTTLKVKTAWKIINCSLSLFLYCVLVIPQYRNLFKFLEFRKCKHEVKPKEGFKQHNHRQAVQLVFLQPP